jgi:hypothetical protein
MYEEVEEVGQKKHYRAKNVEEKEEEYEIESPPNY